MTTTYSGEFGEGTVDSPLYADVRVQMIGEDGNAFAVMGRVVAALRKAGASREATDEYTAEAMAGDYDHLLQVTMRWVEVE